MGPQPTAEYFKLPNLTYSQAPICTFTEARFSMPRIFQTFSQPDSQPTAAPRFRAGRLFVAAAMAAIVCLSGCYSDPESRLAEIRAMQAGGRFEESIQPLRVLLTAEPENEEANYRLGIALVQTGRSSLALWPLMKAAKSESLGVQAGLVLASTLAAQQSYEEAIRAVDNVLKNDPDNIPALYTRARAYIGAAKPERALEDADHVLRLRPDDGAAYSIKTAAMLDLKRYEDAESAQRKLKDITENGKSIDKAARACGVLARFYSDQKQEDKARETFVECLEKYPNHPLVRNWATSFYKLIGDPDSAIGIWQKALLDNPEDLETRIVLANVLAESGRMEEAEEVMVGAARLFDTAAAWQRLASIYRQNGKTTESREALQTALSRARVEPEVLRYALADLFIEEGDLESAQRIADSLREQSYRHMLNATIALAKGDPTEALKRFELGFRLWPNNARARYLAGRAAEQIGDFDRSIREYREAVRVGESETDASLELARIFYSLGQFDTARQFAMRHRKNRPFAKADAHIIAARSNAALGDKKAALELLEMLSTSVQYRPEATVEIFVILNKMDGSKIAIAWVEENLEGIDLADPSYDGLLRLYLDELIAAGRTKDAIALVDAAVAANPESADALELKGGLLSRLGKNGEARKYIDMALELEPEHAGALGLLGTAAAQAEDLEQSLVYFDRAAAADPGNPSYAYSAARLTGALGRRDESIARLRRIAITMPSHVGASNDLAWHLAEMEAELDFALDLATRAARLDPSADTLDTLGWVQLKNGSTDAAIVTLERALEMRPESQSIRYRLGIALSKNGDAVLAKSALEMAIQGGNFPERNAAQAELARLQGS